MTSETAANRPIINRPPDTWKTRRIIVNNDAPCHHCESTAFLVDPDLDTTCIQCAKPPQR